MQHPVEKRLPLPMSPQQTAEAGRAVLSIAARWQEELMRFSLLRMNRYCDLTSKLRQCRQPLDVFALQSAFVQQMLADYGTQSQALAQELFEGMPAGAEGNAGPATPSYETIILEAQHDAARIIDMAKEQAARIIAEAQSRGSRKNGSSRHPRKAASA
jgi:hypothetical protein